MKRFIAIVCTICFILCLSGCTLDEFALLYSDLATKDGLFIAINKIANCCFVAHYSCTDDTDGLEITIPDDYEGIPIKRIGGYFGTGVPSPFSISVADLYMNAPEGSEYHGVYIGDIHAFQFAEEYTVENIVFQLNIGKNIEVIEYVHMDEYYPHINEDGSITFYHPMVNISCSSENKHFYSKDGKLYSKKTNALISDFAYADP